MLVSVALFEIHIAQATSLKEKRRVVQSLKARIRTRHEVSVSEVGLQELHQRARIGVSVVSSDPATGSKVMRDILKTVESDPEAILTGWTEESLDFDEEAALDVPNVQAEEKYRNEEEP